MALLSKLQKYLDDRRIRSTAVQHGKTLALRGTFKQRDGSSKARRSGRIRRPDKRWVRYGSASGSDFRGLRVRRAQRWRRRGCRLIQRCKIQLASDRIIRMSFGSEFGENSVKIQRNFRLINIF